MKKLNQKGVAVLEIILIIFVIGAVAGIGYYVYQAKVKTNKTLDSTAQGAGDAQKSEKKEQAPKDETEGWYLYVSPGKEFQLKLPDGWKLYRYMKGPGLYTGVARNLVYSKGTVATVTEVDGGRDFAAVPFALNYVKSSDFTTPSGTKQAGSLKTKQGLSVDKYKYLVTQDPEAIGPPKGTTQFSYVVVKGNYTVNFVHDIQSGETDQTATVEKAIQTFEFL